MNPSWSRPMLLRLAMLSVAGVLVLSGAWLLGGKAGQAPPQGPPAQKEVTPSGPKEAKAQPGTTKASTQQGVVSGERREAKGKKPKREREREGMREDKPPKPREDRRTEREDDD